MFIATGHIALVLAMGVAILGVLLPSLALIRRWHNWVGIGRPLAILQFALIAVSYVILTRAFIGSDFSVRLVINHSHTDKPLLYRLAGVWGNHEGSMMLWLLILALFSCLVAITANRLAPVLKTLVLVILSVISTALIAFVLLTSNPFARVLNPPFNGNDLNPLLQDPALALHPPLLYLGYVGLAVPYSFAVAALIAGRADAAWAQWVRPWILVSWIFLSLGIALGSWWAYYELGWGGWWFWDPVENVSFMPWLLATALLHSVRVVERRGCLASWTVLLAIAGFSLSLLGTFLVRSGIITSVHAFASDPTRGIVILFILLFFTGGALTLYAIRSPRIVGGGSFALVSREQALLANNVLLTVSAGTILVGTFWPVIVEISTGTMLSVGPPYFNAVFLPFAMALALILPVGSTFAWKRSTLGASLHNVRLPAILTLLLVTGALAMHGFGHTLGILGLALATWIIAGACADHANKIRLGRAPVTRSLVWLRYLPASDYGKLLGHIGFGLMLMGISAVTSWEIEDIRHARPGDTFTVGTYRVEYQGVEIVEGPNYIAEMG
ncbi:MAG: heme lyase CcmF/NrfE family subunit, partial [Rhodobacteraceae bacterium]|nr:heme lyase CcmF/NrfE family subunit [Paracoccaceae bacterium]